MLIKKGAMFGLDARIALAIFGALSVISGAALYSAIQDAKVTSIIAQSEELGKAYTQYYLDTSVNMSVQANPTVVNSVNLIEDFDNNDSWNGPYLALEKITDHALTSPVTNNTVAYRVGSLSDTWGATTDFPNPCATEPCGIWTFQRVANDTIANAIDLKIDGTADRENGKVRVRNIGVSGSTLPWVSIYIGYFN